MKFRTAVFIWGVCIALVLFMFAHFTMAESTKAISNFDKEKFYVQILSTGFIPDIPEEASIEDESQAVYPLSDYERWLVESIVAGESGIEPYWGKVGVASCILNACLLEDKRPEEIQTMYGYAGWKPIEEFESECMEAYGNTDLADEVREAVSQVFDRGEVLNVEILWFCSGYSEWHESQKFVIEIGAHRFFAPW